MATLHRKLTTWRGGGGGGGGHTYMYICLNKYIHQFRLTLVATVNCHLSTITLTFERSGYEMWRLKRSKTHFLSNLILNVMEWQFRNGQIINLTLILHWHCYTLSNTWCFKWFHTTWSRGQSLEHTRSKFQILATFCTLTMHRKTGAPF